MLMYNKISKNEDNHNGNDRIISTNIYPQNTKNGKNSEFQEGQIETKHQLKIISSDTVIKEICITDTSSGRTKMSVQTSSILTEEMIHHLMEECKLLQVCKELVYTTKYETLTLIQDYGKVGEMETKIVEKHKKTKERKAQSEQLSGKNITKSMTSSKNEVSLFLIF